jgi:C1A family cysteine protease
MKAHPVFSLIFIFLPLLAHSQEPQTKSLEGITFGVADQQLIDLLMPIVAGVGHDPRDLIRRQSIKPHLMPVRRAGRTNTEFSYALATCLEYYVNQNKNYKDNLSPEYITLSLPNPSRMNAPDIFRFLAEHGTVSAAIVPYDSHSIPVAVHATSKYQIANYLHLFRESTRRQQKTFEVRKALLRGNPVLIELRADASIKAFKRNDLWQHPASTNELFPFVVVAYDEVQQAFELQGCWGSSWGDSGYMWIPYDDFERNAVNGYVLVPLAEY